MENLDIVNSLFKELEDAEYYGDTMAMNSLSKQIYRRLKEAGEKMLGDPAQHADAANMFLSSAEIIQPFDLYESVNLVKKAISVLEDAARKARDDGDFKQAGDHFKKIGDIYGDILDDAIMARRSYARVIENNERYLKFSEVASKTAALNLYNYYYNLAELNYLVSNWPEVERYARKAIDCSKKHEKYFMVATSYKLLLQTQMQMQLGNKAKMLDLFYEARDYFEKALQSKTAPSKKKNHILIAEIYHVFASFYDLLEDVEEFNHISEKEAECYVDIAKDYERQEDSIGSALHYHSAGLILKKVGKYQEAHDVFVLSGKYYDAAGVLDSAADNYMAAANCMEITDHFLEAIKLIQVADVLYEQSGFIEIAIANTYHALEIHDYIVGETTILRDAIVKGLIDLLEKLSVISEPRDAAHYQVEIAHVAFQERKMDLCFDHLRLALDLLKSSHSITPGDSSAASCNDMLAIVLIALILNRDGDVSDYIAMLQKEGEKAPIGKKYHSVARKFVSQANVVPDTTRKSLKTPLVFNNPLIRNLALIWSFIHGAEPSRPAAYA
nr:hypothetical protein [Candidatus Sigynarchaeota archaeon]